MEEADLSGAHLERSFFLQAHLEGAYLSGAHLEEADLSGAHLERSFFLQAHLEGAYLSGAHLERADLGRAIGLTREQVDSAITDRHTRLPDYLLPPSTPDEGDPPADPPAPPV